MNNYTVRIALQAFQQRYGCQDCSAMPTNETIATLNDVLAQFKACNPKLQDLAPMVLK
jgi:N-acetyl-anhydromuramyl-L-alanine amidase AmpD